MQITDTSASELRGNLSLLGVPSKFAANIDGNITLTVPLPPEGSITIGSTTWDFSHKAGTLTLRTNTGKPGFEVFKAVQELEGGALASQAAPAESPVQADARKRGRPPKPATADIPEPTLPGMPDPAPPAAGRQPPPAAKEVAGDPVPTPPLGPATLVAPPAAPAKTPKPAPSAPAVAAFAPAEEAELPDVVRSMKSTSEVIDFLVPFAYDALYQKAEDEGALGAFMSVNYVVHKDGVAAWIWARVKGLPLFKEPLNPTYPGIPWTQKNVVVLVAQGLGPLHKQRTEDWQADFRAGLRG